MTSDISNGIVQSFGRNRCQRRKIPIYCIRSTQVKLSTHGIVFHVRRLGPRSLFVTVRALSLCKLIPMNETLNWAYVYLQVKKPSFVSFACRHPAVEFDSIAAWLGTEIPQEIQLMPLFSLYYVLSRPRVVVSVATRKETPQQCDDLSWKG